MPKQNLTLASLLLGALLLLLAGCETWMKGGAVYSESKGAFSIRAPDGWMYATSFGHDFIASKDGLILQQIWIAHRELKDALPNSKRVLKDSLQPYEVAEAIVDDLRADHALLNLEIKENVPAVVGGKPGFKISYNFRTGEKLRLSETAYGCIAGGKLWLLRYRAPSRYYFERDAATFEATAKSFQFGKS